MKWQDYIRAARDEAVKSGRAPTKAEMFDLILADPAAEAIYEADRDANARQKALRDIGSVMKEITDAGSDDPAVGRLFETTPYDPPRAITFRDEHGDIRYRGIEHATLAEADLHTVLLEEHISASIRKRRDWAAFVDDLRADLTPGGTVGDALRARQQTTDLEAAA